MKVLHVVPSFFPAFYYGGPIESVLRLCEGEVQAGCQVKVLTTDSNGPKKLFVPNSREKRLRSGLNVRYCRRIAGDSVSIELLRALPKYVRWADVVHLTAVYSFPTLPTLITCSVFGKPLVWSPRGAFMWWDEVPNRLAKRSWEMACRSLVSSRAVLHTTSKSEAFASRKHLPGLRSVVIGNGVRIPRLARDSKRAGLRKILFIGRLHPKKGIELLISAIGLLKKAGDSVPELAIAGEGERAYTCSIRALIKKLRLEKHIRLVGFVNGRRKQSLYRESDAMILPSHSENFGIVVVEALAAGLPVIASRKTPWSNLTTHQCGMWIENTPMSIANAIRKLSLRHVGKMGARGRNWVVREFDWSTIAQRMIRQYQLLIPR